MSEADNHQGTKFWCQQKPLVTSVICYKFQENLLKVWFYTIISWFYTCILSINEKLTLTHIHLTGAHLDPSGQRIAICSAYIFVVYSPMNRNYRKRCSSRMHDILSVMNTRCFHWVLWELAKSWWFLKVWASLALFDGIIKTILMAFSRNIFQAYTGIFVFENNIFTFW